MFSLQLIHTSVRFQMSGAPKGAPSDKEQKNDIHAALAALLASCKKHAAAVMAGCAIVSSPAMAQEVSKATPTPVAATAEKPVRKDTIEIEIIYSKKDNDKKSEPILSPSVITTADKSPEQGQWKDIFEKNAELAKVSPEQAKIEKNGWKQIPGMMDAWREWKERKINKINETVIAKKDEEKKIDETVIAKKDEEKKLDETVITKKDEEKKLDETVITKKDEEKKLDETVITKKDEEKKLDETVITKKDEEKKLDETVIALEGRIAQKKFLAELLLLNGSDTEKLGIIQNKLNNEFVKLQEDVILKSLCVDLLKGNGCPPLQKDHILAIQQWIKINT